VRGWGGVEILQLRDYFYQMDKYTMWLYIHKHTDKYTNESDKDSFSSAFSLSFP
jgi:hypothetical protein